MKSVALLSLFVATSGAVKVPNGWDDLRESMTTCLSTAGSCHDPLDGSLVRGLVEDRCESSGYSWRPTFQTADQLEEVILRKDMSMADEDMAVYLLRVSPHMRVVHHRVEEWAKTIGRPIGDHVTCGDTPFMYVYANKGHMKAAESLQAVSVRDGTTQSVFDVVVPYPDGLKYSQELRGPLKEGAETVDLFLQISHGCSGSHEETHNIARLMSRNLASSEHGLTSDHNIVADTKRLVSVSGVKVSEMDRIHEILAAHPEVQFIEPKLEYNVHNYDAAVRTQTGNYYAAAAEAGPGPDRTATNDVPFWQKGITGEGQVVGIGDSGLDTKHCMFAEANPATDIANNQARNERKIYDYEAHRKVVQYAAFVDGIAGAPSDHGTHVAGTVAGKVHSPNLANNLLGTSDDFNGMAPDAKIAFFDLGRPGSGGIFPPNSLADTMFPPSYDAGARIHTNSWGSVLNAYTTNAQDIDQYMYENQDYLVLIAAGNSGQSNTGVGKVGSPATSKNGVAVGAAQNSDRSMQHRGSNCPSPSAGKNCAEGMALFSSDGPAFDGRILPHVVAPGFFILSSGSETTCDVIPMAGTSMATPAVAGTSALIRQYFEDGYYPAGTKTAGAAFKPMGALVKAVLVNSGRAMTGVYNQTPLQDKPNNINGWGSVTIGDTLPLADGPTKLYVNGGFENMPMLADGAEDSYDFVVAAAPQGDFKITIAWTDPPAQQSANKALLNDLDLQVTVEGQTLQINGNAGVDNTNNIEQAVIPAGNIAAYAGKTISVKVKGTAVPVGAAQPYAIVVRGPFADGTVDAGNGGGNGGGVAQPGNGAGAGTGGDGGAAGGGTGTVNPGNGGGGTGNGGGLYDSINPSAGQGSQVGGGIPGEDGLGTTTIALIAVGSAFVVGGGAYAATRKSSPPSAVGGAKMDFGMQQGGMAGGGLPVGWATASDPSTGQTYYFNQGTGQVSWTPPTM